MAALVSVGLAAGLPAQSPSPARLLPVDEAPSRPDFFAFRARLQAAIAARDPAEVLAVVHPNIRNSFGDDNGKANFEKRWQPAAPNSELWGALGEVLALGGTFASADSFVAPYVFSRWPDGTDAFEHVAIVGEGVRIRTAPRADSQEADSSSFGILPFAWQAAQTEGWTAVRLSGNRIGYVASRYVRSAIDYRAAFSKEEGRWEMVLFLAGD